MSNRTNNNSPRIMTLQQISAQAMERPQAFVRAEHRLYIDRVREIAGTWMNNRGKLHMVLLSGPSASGKTTTAGILCRLLREAGWDAHTVSLDNFFRAKYPEGHPEAYDPESPQALRLDRLAEVIGELMTHGTTGLPEYDFSVGAPAAHTVRLTLGNASFVIFEGIQALHPIVGRCFPDSIPFHKLLVRPSMAVTDNGSIILDGAGLRLTRRLLRDQRFRSSPLTNTFSMWPQVIAGESQYLFPYVGADVQTIDSAHAFEPCLYTGLLLPQLREIPPDMPYSRMAQALTGVLSRFPAMSAGMLPEDSMLHEFID